MTFFTVIGFLTIVIIFVYYWVQEQGAWYTSFGPAFVAVWERVPHVLSFSTLLTIFKEGVDVMLTRLQKYRDQRKNRIEEAVKKEVAQVLGKAKKEAYEKGYEDAKEAHRANGTSQGTHHSGSREK